MPAVREMLQAGVPLPGIERGDFSLSMPHLPEALAGMQAVSHIPGGLKGRGQLRVQF